MDPSTSPGDDSAPLSRRIAAMFGRIAPGYDRANRLLSCGLDVLWRRSLVSEMRDRFGNGAGRTFVDLAAGTMDLSLEMARRMPEAKILALDLSLPMLRAGDAKRRKAAPARRGAMLPVPPVLPVLADAFSLPLAGTAAPGAEGAEGAGGGAGTREAPGIDALTCAFGLRNMLPRPDALREMHRVLKPGGSVWILEFGSAGKKLWGGLYNFYLQRVLPLIGGALAGDRAAYDYLAATIRDFPTDAALAREIRACGFSRVLSRSLCGGIVFLHLAEK